MLLKTIHVSRGNARGQKMKTATGILTAAAAFTGLSGAANAQVVEESPLCVEFRGMSGSLARLTDVQRAAFESMFRASGYVSAHVCRGQDTSDSDDGPHPLGDAYTRWQVDLVATTENGVRDYRAENRGWVSRLLTDRTISTTHSVNIAMSDPELELAIPLVSAGYDDSGPDGVEFDTTLRYGRYNLPFFRVEANSSFDMTATARHSRRHGFGGVSQLLDIFEGALSIITTPPTLLTRLNSDEVSDTSTAISGVLQALTDSSFDEAVSDSYALNHWRMGDAIYVAAQLPIRRPNESRDRRYHYVGMLFRVSLACPRESIFLSYNMCTPDTERNAIVTRSVDTATILGFRLAENKTIRQHITDQEWFTSFVADSTHTPVSVRNLCRILSTNLQELGFTSTDVRRILQAAFEGMAELSDIDWDDASRCGKAAGEGTERVSLTTAASTTPPVEEGSMVQR